MVDCHVLRREEDYVGKRVMGWMFRGKEGEEDQRGGERERERDKFICNPMGWIQTHTIHTI